MLPGAPGSATSRYYSSPRHLYGPPSFEYAGVRSIVAPVPAPPLRQNHTDYPFSPAAGYTIPPPPAHIVPPLVRSTTEYGPTTWSSYNPPDSSHTRRPISLPHPPPAPRTDAIHSPPVPWHFTSPSTYRGPRYSSQPPHSQQSLTTPPPPAYPPEPPLTKFISPVAKTESDRKSSRRYRQASGPAMTPAVGEANGIPEVIYCSRRKNSKETNMGSAAEAYTAPPTFGASPGHGAIRTHQRPQYRDTSTRYSAPTSRARSNFFPVRPGFPSLCTLPPAPSPSGILSDNSEVEKSDTASESSGQIYRPSSPSDGPSKEKILESLGYSKDAYPEPRHPPVKPKLPEPTRNAKPPKRHNSRIEYIDMLHERLQTGQLHVYDAEHTTNDPAMCDGIETVEDHSSYPRPEDFDDPELYEDSDHSPCRIAHERKSQKTKKAARSQSRGRSGFNERLERSKSRKRSPATAKTAKSTTASRRSKKRDEHLPVVVENEITDDMPPAPSPSKAPASHSRRSNRGPVRSKGCPPASARRSKSRHSTAVYDEYGVWSEDDDADADVEDDNYGRKLAL